MAKAAVCPQQVRRYNAHDANPPRVAGIFVVYVLILPRASVLFSIYLLLVLNKSGLLITKNVSLPLHLGAVLHLSEWVTTSFQYKVYPRSQV